MKTTSKILGFFSILLLVFTDGRSSDIVRVRDREHANQFQFVRIRYNGYVGSWGIGAGFGSGRFVPPWMHDYPRAERNFLKILSELTTVQTTPESFLILDLDDPEIMNYPVLYVSEPGYWDITDRESGNLREYLRRGGFVIFDDFRGQQEWNSFTACMKKVFPERSFRELSSEHPVFHCFYDIDPQQILPPYAVPGLPKFLRTLRRGRTLASRGQLQQRHRRLLGVVGRIHHSHRFLQRSLQVRYKLRHLRPHPLAIGGEYIPHERKVHT